VEGAAGVRAKHPRYERVGLRDLCQQIHDVYKANDVARLTTEMYLSDMVPAMRRRTPSPRWRTARSTGCRSTSSKGASPACCSRPIRPAFPLLIPGERFNATIVRYLQFARDFNERFPGFETDIHGLVWSRKSRRTRITGYAEASIGRDSNINAATSSGSIYVPLFNTNFTLGSSSVKASDNFMSVGGGAELTHVLGGGVSLFAGVDLKQRMHRDWDIYDNRSVDYRAGFQAVHGKDVFRLTVGRNDYDLDQTPYRRIGSLGMELRHAFDARTQIIGFGQVSEIKYLQTGSQSYSSNQIIAGLGLVRSLEGDGNPIVFGSAYFGEDTATRNRGDGDRDIYGARIGYQRSLRDDLDVVASLSAQRSNYLRENPLFMDFRKETQYDLGLGLNWRFQRDWSLKPQLTYTRSDSNFRVYDYDRYELMLTLRKDFR
jgi:hypothetical protein